MHGRERYLDELCRFAGRENVLVGLPSGSESRITPRTKLVRLRNSLAFAALSHQPRRAISQILRIDLAPIRLPIRASAFGSTVAVRDLHFQDLVVALGVGARQMLSSIFGVGSWHDPHAARFDIFRH